MFIFLRSGVLIRNFANKALRQGLINSGYQFVIFAPSIEHPTLLELFDSTCFKFEKLDLDAGWAAMSKSRLGTFLILVRRHTYSNTKFGQNGSRESLLEAMRCEQIKKASFIGRIYYNGVIICARIASGSHVVRKFLRWLEGKVIPCDQNSDAYRRYKPIASIVTSLGFDQDSLYMREAENHGADKIVLLKNWDVPTTRGIGASIPDHILVWNEIMKNEVEQYHDITSEKIQICGISQWDYYFDEEIKVITREKFSQKFKLVAQNKIIYFAMTTPTHFHHNIRLLRIIAEAIFHKEIKGPVQLLARLHPSYILSSGLLNEAARRELDKLREQYGEFLSYSFPKSLDYDGLVVPTLENDIDLKEILSHSDLMVTVYSTQMVEGLFFDIPIVNAGLWKFRNTDLPISTYEKWDHIKQVVDTDAISYCYDKTELIRAINEGLENRNTKSNARQKLADHIIPPIYRGSAGTLTEKLIGQTLSSKIANT